MADLDTPIPVPIPKKPDPVKATTIQPVQESVAVVAETVGLESFCRELSTRDRRVELINAFFKSEQKEQHLVDTQSSFALRFEQFTKKTV